MNQSDNWSNSLHYWNHRCGVGLQNWDNRDSMNYWCNNMDINVHLGIALIKGGRWNTVNNGNYFGHNGLSDEIASSGGGGEEDECGRRM